MADIIEKIVFDDSDAIKSLQDLDKQMADLNAKIRQTEMSYEEAFAVAKDAMEDSSKAAEEAKKATTAIAVETVKASKASNEWKATLKEQIRDLNIFGQSVGGVIDGLKNKANAMRTVASAVGGGTKALQAFKIALVSTGIGAIVVALGSLVALLTKTQKGMDAVNVVTKALGAALDATIGRVAKFGSGIVKLFGGDFKGAFDDAKAAVSGFGEEIRKEARAAAEVEKQLQRIRDIARANNAARAETNKQLKQQEQIYKDQTKAIDEREGALDKARTAAKFQFDRDRDNAAKLLALKEKDLERNKEDLSLIEARDEAKANLAKIEEEYAGQQIQFNQDEAEIKNTIVQREKEAAAAAKQRAESARKLNEELTKQIDLIEKAYEKVQLSQLSPEDRLKAEADIARAAVEAEFRKLEEIAKAAKKEVDLSKEKAEILKQIDREYYRSLDSLRNDNLAQIKAAGDQQVQFASTSAAEAAAAIGQIKPDLSFGKNIERSFVEALDNLKFKFLSTFDLSEEDLASIGNSLGQIYASFGALTDAALQRNDELIEGIRNRREALEEELDEELALQEKGLANNASIKQRELEELAKQEEKAQKERERLQRQQARAQLLIDTASQVSSLVTMAANVLKAESGKGLLGVPFALAAIAAMIGIFSSFKAQAKSAGGADVRLASGGSVADSGAGGFVNTSGRTDRNGARGHRVEDSNLILGGNEFVVGEGPANQHAEFLKALNAGKFSEVDLMKELQGSSSPIDVARVADRFGRRAEIIGMMKDHEDKAFQVRAMDAVMGKHIGGVVRELAKNGGRTYVIPNGGGKVVHVAPDGSKKIVDYS